MNKLDVHMCSHGCEESHKCLLTCDTKNKPPWLHELKLAQTHSVPSKETNGHY